MKIYIVIMLIPSEPYLIYYCGMKNKQPLLHDAVGLCKQMPLDEAEIVFNAINPSNKKINICLIEWVKFVEIYQFIGSTKENFIKNSLKSK